LLLLASVLAGWLIWSGHLVVTMKAPEQSVGLYTKVCGDGVVSSYNDAVSSTTYETYGTNLDSIYKEVSGLSGNESDPTCLLIEYQYFLGKGQIADVAKVAAQIKTLADEGLYPSIKLVGIESLDIITSRTTRGDGDGAENGDGS